MREHPLPSTGPLPFSTGCSERLILGISLIGGNGGAVCRCTVLLFPISPKCFRSAILYTSLIISFAVS